MVRLSAADNSETVSSGRLRRGSFIGARFTVWNCPAHAPGIGAGQGPQVISGGLRRDTAMLRTLNRGASIHDQPTMNILLLGSGGREHALAWKMAASPLADR